MKALFLLPYVYFVYRLVFEAINLIRARRITAAVIGLFWTFALIPDFLILDAYGIGGSYILVFVFVCAIPIIQIAGRKKIRLKRSDTGLILLLILVLGFGLISKYVYRSSTDYYGTKLFNYIYSLMIPLALIIVYNDEIIKSYDFWKSILLYGILAYAFKNFSLVGIINFRIFYERDYSELKNIIYAARALGVGCLLYAYDLIREFRVSRLVYFGILIVQLLLFESRGPIFALMCAFVALWYFRVDRKRLVIRFQAKHFLAFTVTAIVLVSGVKYLVNSGSLDRVVTAIQSIIGGSSRSETRMYLYPLSIQAIKDSFPFGVGFGNTKLAITKLNSYFINNYPHNLVLELFLEEGFFLALPFMILFVKWFKTIFVKDRYSSHTLLFFSLFLFSFINSMFSGDISGNNGVFFFGYMAYSSYRATKASGIANVKGGKVCA